MGPFEWHNPNVGPRRSRRQEVYREELRERAALLYRLGFDAAQAQARLAARVRWDYEVGPHQAPIAQSEIGGLVDAVYARHGAGAGPLTV